MFDEIRARYFPYELPQGVVARSVDGETAKQVRDALLYDIFPHSDRYTYTVPEERKPQIQVLTDIYRQLHFERIIFYDGDTPIGWSIGRMQDALTYRMGNTGLIPAYRRKGIYTTFAKHLLTYIKELGYERVNSNHHPNNIAVITAKMQLGFVITGQTLREDIGPVIQMTHFFYDDRRQAFHDTLSIVPYD